MKNKRPLEGLVVLEFAQFLAGPFCGLRLADLGARVIKIERTGGGDLGRGIYLSEPGESGVNTLFQAINRNKESFAANLKNPADKQIVNRLVEKADVVIQNFRPGVFDRLGFSYEALAATNPGIVYASVTGYGSKGPWVGLPGQDLLAQARSGIMWLNGSSGHPPQPVGLALADMLAGHNLTEAILAALVQRGVSGHGAKVDTSLLESLMDFQFEVLTTHLNDGRQQPVRSAAYGAHSYLPAPYGVYPTEDGFIAIAMTPVDHLMGLLEMEAPERYSDPALAFSDRDAINTRMAERFRERSTQAWLDVLQPHDVWCAEILDWDSLLQSEGFEALDMLQTLNLPDNQSVQTTRVPFRFHDETLKSERPAPEVGEHNRQIRDDFGLWTASDLRRTT